MSALTKLLHARIQVAGPLSVAAYMQLALTHPQYGYYTRQQSDLVFGPKGDFTTAPEVSQVFGELVGIWAVSQWMGAKQPARTRLVELGPGRGTLVADALRAIGKFPGLRDNIEVVLVDMSPTMKAEQRARLHTQHPLCNIQWHDSLAQVQARDDCHTIIVANEFFDALPTHQFEYAAAGWRERLIVSSDPSDECPHEFRFVLSSRETPVMSLLLAAGVRLPVVAALGQRVEFSVEAWHQCQHIARLLAPGNALLIDYGEETLPSDTLRAFRAHEEVHVFSQPGLSDLTVDVNFGHLRTMLQHGHLGNPAMRVTGPVTQGNFLRDLGFAARVQSLHAMATKNGSTGAARGHELVACARRLVDPADMGSRFKVLGVNCSSALGFTTAPISAA